MQDYKKNIIKIQRELVRCTFYFREIKVKANYKRLKNDQIFGNPLNANMVIE